MIIKEKNSNIFILIHESGVDVLLMKYSERLNMYILANTLYALDIIYYFVSDILCTALRKYAIK